MAQFKAAESKLEQFRSYLEQADVLESLTNVLVALYEEPEKPTNALEFVKEHLGIPKPEPVDVESLRAEVAELRQRYEKLLEENRDLKEKLSQIESAQEEEQHVE
ncbi:c-Myc-binding protein-like [Erpetoichthys calabaricus]|uniref:c-Myc-binding protein-like n=1 Tax=Erpetoichthys calabaricus TaxID=27687 RepID=UPI002234043A|nr:c-Myc-binding protein-like [Erpetoichthys calabaricus]